jgi:hypothetical protein
MKVIHDDTNKQINFLDERFYLGSNDQYYPSVTTVLEVYPKGHGFMQWLKDIGNNADEVVKRASEQGTKVHNAIEQYLKGVQLDWQVDGVTRYTLEEWLMILKFVEFYETYKPEVIAVEVEMVSDDLKLGGTIDLVCKINGQVWLIDNKTSNAIHTSHELQLSAYAKMWNDTHPEATIDRVGIMWLKSLTRGEDKTGKKLQGKGWQVKEFDRNYKEAYQLFEHVRAIWDEENKNYAPKNVIYPSIIKSIYE